jgi:hypothetical protein
MTEQDDRERLIKVEAKYEALKEQFHSFKDEVTRTLERLIHDVQDIKLTIAKYLGGFTVVIALIEVALKKLL